MNRKSILIVGIISLFLVGSTRVYAQGSMKETDELDFAQGLLSRGMYDMAISQYQKFITEYPHSPSLQEAYLSLGEGYFLSQDFAKAIDAFNQFKLLFPNSDQFPLSLLRLGQIDIQQKKYDEALKELTSIDVQKQLKGETLQAFDFYTAQAYVGKGDTASALDYFQKAAQVDGASKYTAYAFKERGKIYTQNKQYTQAIDAYTKAIPVAGDDSIKGELIYRIAEVQFLSGQYADAIKGFGEVIDQYPDFEFTQNAIANMLSAYFNLGQYDLLLSEYQKETKAIKDDDAYFAIHFSAVRAYIELQKYDQANMLLNRVVAFPALKPQESAKVFVAKASILIKQKKYKDGLALLDAYSSQDPDNTDETLFLKAQGYFGTGDFDHAFNFFENVYLNFSQSRFSKAALLGEAHARQEMGRFKESEALFLKYYDLQDQADLKSEALYDTIIVSIKAGDIHGVINSAQEYLKAFPNEDRYTEVLLILADNDDKNNQPQEAVNLLQGYLAKTPTPQRPNSVYFLLGFNEQVLGNSDLALAAYSKVDAQKENGIFYFGALKNMAIIYLNQKKEDQAKVFFDQLITQSGSNDLQIKTYIWVANEYLKELKFSDVLRIAAEAEKKFSPKDLLEINYFKAEALRALGRCDEAYKSYDLVIASTDKNMYTGSAHIGYGLCLATANKFDEAKAELQKSLDENADDYTITVHARFEMASIDASQGNFADALKFYLLIATIYDDDYYCSQSLLQAGKIFERLKRDAEAKKMYSEILDKYKNSKAAPEAKERVLLLK